MGPEVYAPKPAQAGGEQRAASDPREQRQGADRRRGPRRADERSRLKRKRMSLAFLCVLVLCLAGVSVWQYQDYAKKRSKARGVVVKINGIGEWKANRERLAEYFARQEILANMNKENKEPLPPPILNQQISLSADTLLANDEYLLDRVSKMPWSEFEKQAERTKKNGEEQQATADVKRAALRSAAIQ